MEYSREMEHTLTREELKRVKEDQSREYSAFCYMCMYCYILYIDQWRLNCTKDEYSPLYSSFENIHGSSCVHLLFWSYLSSYDIHQCDPA